MLNEEIRESFGSLIYLKILQKTFSESEFGGDMKKMDPGSRVSLTVETKDFIPFGFILQQGFRIEVQTGCSLKSLLGDQFGISSEYIKTRIKTIFFNGKPVDDYNSAIITGNAVLALSAAMPGLVGATFRSGGILSPFRSGISFKNTAESSQGEKQGKVTIKLFNLLVKEIGPRFLEAGIWVETHAVKDVFLCLDRSTNILMNDRYKDTEKIIDFFDKNDFGEIQLCVRQMST